MTCEWKIFEGLVDFKTVSGRVKKENLCIKWAIRDAYRHEKIFTIILKLLLEMCCTYFK
jgi:hypothetical protein